MTDREMRRRTFIHTDRAPVAQTPMLDGHKERSSLNPWVLYSLIITFWAPPFLLRSFGLHEKGMQQAWREKCGLCFIILVLCAIVAFLTLALPQTLCPDSQNVALNLVPYNSRPNFVGLYGDVLNTTNAISPSGLDFNNIPGGTDVTNLFRHPAKLPNTACDNPNIQKFAAVSFDHCTANTKANPAQCSQAVDRTGLTNLKIPPPSTAADAVTFTVGYSWPQLDTHDLANFFVYNGLVLNFDAYMAGTQADTTDRVDTAIRRLVDPAISVGGKDGTLLFNSSPELKAAMDCLISKYRAGRLDKDSTGCFFTEFFLIISLVCIMGIVLTRFVMAVLFNWFLSFRLTKRAKKTGDSVVAPHVLPGRKGGGKQRAAPWAFRNSRKGSSGESVVKHVADTSDELYTVLLVTCYSEGETSLRYTIESLAATTYGDDHKMIFVIADGIITGSGETRSTPDICKDLMELVPGCEDPEPQSYIAVASGSKQHNMAKVYAGHFVFDGRRIPMMLCVKCGTESEAATAPKPGNRGKRDSQLILMSFFSRVTYNDRMCPLDYDLFRKMTHLMNVTPDYFEVVLMVDADTKVYPDSLRLLINAVLNDPMIMGLCGETKIANKRHSWVTGIQVFEYYISHHLGKAFESIFGGVTCLPGCFCMYRLKARKGQDDWVPILTKPEIVQEYSQNVVETLHQKNLLLLGEDRFLTTLMLRNFPARKMMFVPQAVCKTVVPDEFSILLSQRRRWINSTIHNLLELVLVRNLCGIFCFSMQFVVLMELIGTVVLPVAIFMTYYLIFNLFHQEFNTFTSTLPLLMLVAVLGLPAVLILITTRKIIYCMWMIVYLIALPIWNFILPVYAYWHFDDFSWGETRKVEGEIKGDDHGSGEGAFDASSVPLRKWEEYERRRLQSARTPSSSSPPSSSSDAHHADPYGSRSASGYASEKGTGLTRSPPPNVGGGNLGYGAQDDGGLLGDYYGGQYKQLVQSAPYPEHEMYRPPPQEAEAAAYGYGGAYGQQHQAPYPMGYPTAYQAGPPPPQAQHPYGAQPHGPLPPIPAQRSHYPPPEGMNVPRQPSPHGAYQHDTNPYPPDGQRRY